MSSSATTLRAKESSLGCRTSKVLTDHMERLAFVYVRQSTTRQVIEHQESTALQYDLSRRAVDLGWPRDRVIVIDDDQGQSGTSAEHRHGFQRLLAEVSLNHVGIILGMEMSRLARSCKDWYQLLELCAVFNVLLADQDGLYDPGNYNDRLLLGLKGTMSEAELHILRGRLDKGRLHKAERGRLFSHLPVGYIRLPNDEVQLDPDEQAQSAVQLVFEKFEELGSVRRVYRYLVQHQILMPVRPHHRVHNGEIDWRRPCLASVYNMLRHPIYAGAYSYGRHPIDPRRKIPGRPGVGKTTVATEHLAVLRKGELPGYITWNQFLANQQRLTDNRAGFAMKGCPREGEALLSGLLKCGHCGHRMYVRYRDKVSSARYVCRNHDPVGDNLGCGGILARVIDDLVVRQLLQVLQPAELELALRAEEDVQRERERLDIHWRKRLERARFEVVRARRQYDQVEPDNRLVARELESRWEAALRSEQEVQEQYSRFKHEQPVALNSDEREIVRKLASDIPSIWCAATTTAADRQEIIRQLIEHVAVTIQEQTEVVEAAIYWCGGYISRQELARPVSGYNCLKDYDQLLNRVKELRDEGKAAGEIAGLLNDEGFRTPKGTQRFRASVVRAFLSRAGLTSRRTDSRRALQGQNEWWMNDLADELGIPRGTICRWIRSGWLSARKVTIAGRRWVAWADAQELTRLRDLRQFLGSHPGKTVPVALRTPIAPNGSPLP